MFTLQSSLIAFPHPWAGSRAGPRDGATQGLERGSQNHSAEGRHLAEN